MNKYFSVIKKAILGEPSQIELPTVIQFPVIDICNSRCQMCRIWENKDGPTITARDLELGLENKLFSKVTSVGINGGEPTLRKDLPELVKALSASLPRLRNISLITNAFKVEQVVRQVDAISIALSGTETKLDVMVSLDGYGEVHDLVRGRKNSFINAVAVIDELRSRKSANSIRIGCTVVKDNVLHLRALLEFCISQDLYIKFRLGVPHKRLYVENLADPFALSPDDTFELVEFMEGLIRHYEKDSYQKHFYRSLINQILYGSPRSAGCDWRGRGVTITSRGEMAYCALESNVITSNIASGSAYVDYFSKVRHLQDIKNNKCSDCRHDYVGTPTAKEYRKILVDELKGMPFVKDRIERSSLIKSYVGVKKALKFRKRANLVTRSTSKALPVPKSSIMICGWYGTETLGDKAILAGVVDSLRQSFKNDLQIFLVSLFPYVSKNTVSEMDELAQVTVIGHEDASALLGDCKMLVFGGGPLMAIDDLAPMENLFAVAKNEHVPTCLAGCGFGPTGRRYLNASLTRIMSNSDYIVWRDQSSYDLATSFGCRNDDTVVVSDDPSVVWLDKYYKAKPVSNQGKGRTVIALGLRAFPALQYAPSMTKKSVQFAVERFERELVSLLERLIVEGEDIVIKPIPMCTNHFGDDDRWYYSKLFRQSKLIQQRLDSTLLGAQLTPVEYIQHIQSSGCMIGMRFHSLVFANALGIPSIAIDYTLGKGKVYALANRFSMPCLPYDEFDADFYYREVKRVLASPSKVALLDPEFPRQLNNAIAKLGLL